MESMFKMCNFQKVILILQMSLSKKTKQTKKHSDLLNTDRQTAEGE